MGGDQPGFYENLALSNDKSRNKPGFWDLRMGGDQPGFYENLAFGNDKSRNKPGFWD